jgi:hypothetical protein
MYLAMFCPKCAILINTTDLFTLTKDQCPEDTLVCPRCATVLNNWNAKANLKEMFLEALQELYLNPCENGEDNYKHLNIMAQQISGIGGPGNREILGITMFNEDPQFVVGYRVLKGDEINLREPFLKKEYPLVCDGNFHRFFWDLCPLPLRKCDSGRFHIILNPCDSFSFLESPKNEWSVRIYTASIKEPILREYASSHDFYFVIGDDIYTYPIVKTTHVLPRQSVCNRIENAEYYEQLRQRDDTIDLRAIKRV